MDRANWTFFDYVSDGGRNAIKDWVAGQPHGTRLRLKARLTAVLSELALVDQFDRPLVGQLRGGCAGLYELRFTVDKILFRPIGYYGPGKQGEFTLLVGATERGGRLVPTDVCEVAFRRLKSTADRSHICEHDFS